MNSITADIKRNQSKSMRKINIIYYPIVVVFVVLGFFLTNYHEGGLFRGVRYNFWGITYYGNDYFYGSYFQLGSLIAIILIICLLLLLPIINKTISNIIVRRIELTINDEIAFGLYGKVVKKEFSVPLEQITNVTIKESLFDKIRSGKTIVIESASSKMRFPYVHNAADVLNFALERIKEFKANYGNINSDAIQTTQIIKNEFSEADELAKFKKLLDDGVITQGEFDAKKKQLLGL